jgi:uncharacterized protein YyaL (SSP411 family)
MSDLHQTNRLADETSPYLKQHAHNPVDWYPWGPEALERARKLDRPIFLSVGYSACHWCHVMEHESFENAETARILNEHFISIKVDREERPDIDQIYMTAVQLLTGQGGWPMSVFLTPDLKPFYGGTYFPPDERYGRPSFKRVLLALADTWRTRRDELVRSAGEITQHVQEAGKVRGQTSALDVRLLRDAVTYLRRIFDSTYGGFGGAPKFPHTTDLRLLLRAWKRFGDDEALEMARLTLNRMASGGIYDHLGGGFHRYSTDERWLVPHFEKMLYDNALLSVAYLEAFQATGEPLYRQVVEDTLAYVLREMTSREGAFYSAQDADSEGVEGKSFVWSAEEVNGVLGEPAASEFTYVYDVTPSGNWEGRNILHRNKTDEQDARMLNMPLSELRRIVREARFRLLEVRNRRVQPGRDEKILTSWNALMIKAFAEAAQVLEKPEYARSASRAAAFILTGMRDPDGFLFRTCTAGSRARLRAYLEDYSYLIDALVSLYEATFEARWIEEAVRLAALMVDQFWDEESGGFFYTGRDHEVLISRTKDPQDSSIPSGNSMAAMGLLRLGKITGRAEWVERAEQTLTVFSGLMESAPTAAAQLLLALDFYLGPVQEFAVVGDFSDPEMTRVLRAIRIPFRPKKVLAMKSVSAQPEIEKVVPLLAGKPAGARVTTYVCENFSCRAPLIGAEALEAVLDKE